MVAPPSLDDVRLVPYFKSLTSQEMEAVARVMVSKSFHTREVIVREGDPSNGFWLLRAGKARIFRTGTDGREQTFRLVSPGDTFGEVPVFDHQPNPSTVEALDASETILIPTRAMLVLIERYPKVAAEVLRHFASRIRSFTSLVEQISLQTVPGRIARYLYQLAREEGRPTPDGIVVPRQITQQDLASLVGSVREVVSRSLRVMEEDGIVAVGRKEILIIDLGALQKLF